MKKLLSLVAIAAVATTLFVASNASAAIQGQDTSTAVIRTSGKSKLPTATANADVTVQAGGYTHYWGARNGCWNLGLGLGFSPRWPVTVSATEVDGGNNEVIGAAIITVHNVAIHSNGWVTAVVCVDWGSPLYINVHYVWA